MARPKKQGLDYFPMPVDFDHDPKLAMVIGEYGHKAEHITMKLLGFLFKEYGYFLPWNEGVRLMFAKRVAYITGGSSANLVNEVVGGLVRWSFFDKGMFDSSQFLTSIDIQQTWLEATRKRKERFIDQSIWLLNKKKESPETPLIPEETHYGRLLPPETPLIPEVIPQSKVKESKEEIKKEETSPISQQPSWWNLEKHVFLTNQLFLEQFSVARRLPAATVTSLRGGFITDVELRGELMDARELQKYFVNWYNKGQREGWIDQQGNLKNGQPTVTQTPGLNAREAQSERILDLFD